MAASERYNTSTDTPRSLCIVPVPSSPQSVKKRGRLHMLPLARHLVERLNVRFLHDEFPLSAHVCTCLSMDKHVHKSVTRSTKKSRSQRLNKGLLITASHELNHSQVILIDDIITTGSTVRACVRILRAQGAHIVAVCALADADKSNTEHADIEGNTDA
ncbi:ComF family protein [Alloscardovia criceti]|uniref:ComF family protein n=1 Tax=Alloscardovia criceti TaxID=356828 RepID=UPI0014613F00|nr:phosphoribosyltransferase family protein [Alloscardovia criceti]